MKRRLIPLALILILTACSPAATVVPTAVPPTFTDSPAPMQTLTVGPNTSTPEPTATTKPTDVPMPNGWIAISETREIGGRQVALNENGNAATQIDGEWYPVDAKGCFYTEFFNPETQKDPKIDALIQKLNDENSLVLGSKQSEFTRNNGASLVGYGTSGGKFPNYWETDSDAILADQKICFNDQTNEWEHILEYVLPRDSKTMSQETKVMRAVVGWIRDGKYVTFTYKQEGVSSKVFPNLSGQPTQKAQSVQEAFELWQQMINNQEQVGVGIPLNILVNATGNMSEDEFQKVFPQLISEIHDRDSAMWPESVEDPEFKSWALSDRSLLKAWSKSTLLARQTTVSNRKKAWRYMGEQAAINKLLEPTLRSVTVLKK
jgi:hypothetical protein